MKIAASSSCMSASAGCRPLSASQSVRQASLGGRSLHSGRASGGVIGGRRVLRCRAESDSKKSGGSEKTISTLDSLLGIEPEETEPEPASKPAPKPVTKVESAQPKPKPAQKKTTGESDWLLEGFEEDGKIDIPNRAISSVSYLLPLLDGLHYGRYFLMQVPQFALALLPIYPAIELFESYRWLQIVVFFGLALGVANNRSMPAFTRFNAQQAILLDIIQIVPQLLLGNKGPPPGDEWLLQATIIVSNTVFLYVYLCSVTGALGSLNAKAIRLPLLGGAAEQQASR